jgi:cystathionine beta-lyase
MMEPSPDIWPDIETICAHWGEDPSRFQGAVTPPIFQNSLFTSPDCETRAKTYALSPDEGPRVGAGIASAYDYTRVTNPTTEIAEAKIAALEQGDMARCFGSGMGAISAAILSCVKAGDHVVAVETIYGPTRQFLKGYLPRFGIETTLVEGSNPQDFADALQPNTTLIYLESPSSVVMKQQDLAAVAALAKERGIATIADNSWASPIFQNPIAFGIDLVVHSATKYLGGHSDIIAGVVIGAKERMTQLLWDEGCLLGAVLDPFASWLLLRGLRTLPIRMERHHQTTRQLANALLEHPKVANVFYPGLKNDPHPDLTHRQLRGTSGLLSIELKSQSREASYAFVNALRYFGIGCSWGGFESLALPMTVPARMIGGSDDSTHWVIRLHLGLESANDLWNDLEAALSRI